MRFASVAALAVLVVTPAFAAPADNAAWSGASAQVPGGSIYQVSSPGAARVSCIDLMERAFYLNDPASLERTMDAHREMELARDAYQQGDEASCRQHALNALQDRA